eukprot:CAMPEP_0119281320 /NCGR_PEP_ID=MMETSP1329-20130426/24473_1 /TAXON_ID=114041 /ORGANISM="Genus nov. species nov., Strain RCC1024" /LENGTH=548 /DNA_ID=CAMNT_0007281929 /DNA_START=190 /DNA_END=1833 /DNA_ORIENTATION=-
MGKNQHSKDRMFVTATEHARGEGGYKKKVERGMTGALPFESCALTLLPFQHPCCARDGILFDALALLPFAKARGRSPATGAPLAVKDVIRLKMAKNMDGQWHCPVTCKVFTNHSRVCAVATTGNVYSYEAVKELCLKRPPPLLDLLDSTPFKKEDLIMLHDPDDKELVKKRDLSSFWHLAEERAKRAAQINGSKPEDHIKTNAGDQAVLKEARRNVAARDEKRLALEAERLKASLAPDRPENKGLTAAFLRCCQLGATTAEVTGGSLLTSGATSGSFTSSALTVSTTAALRPATRDELQQARWKLLRGLGKKGYCRLVTSHGDLNVEVHCDMVPRAAENFLGLCAAGYYDGAPFHRVVKHFVAQGGDPTGLGTGGESLWGARFADEFDSRLVHDQRGVLAYANDGKDRNRSQFYCTFKSCQHLDNKHTVFGRLVGGQDTLAKIERVAVDESDDHRPKGDGVKILSTAVFVDPTIEADELFEAKLKAAIDAREQQEAGATTRAPAPVAKPAVKTIAAGPHTATSVGKRPAAPAADLPAATAKKTKKVAQ